MPNRLYKKTRSAKKNSKKNRSRRNRRLIGGKGPATLEGCFCGSQAYMPGYTTNGIMCMRLTDRNDVHPCRGY
jgi:hypothetical protein